jgi:hypothetical protein
MCMVRPSRNGAYADAALREKPGPDAPNKGEHTDRKEEREHADRPEGHDSHR